MRKTQRWCLIATLFFGAILANGAQPESGQTSPAPPTDEARFLKQAARNNDMQIALAEVGGRKASNPDLKSFCRQFQRSQIQLNEKLKPLARNARVSIDQSLTPEDLKELARLEAINGSAFDRKVVLDLLGQQQQELRNMRQEAKQGTTEQLTDYAKAHWPNVQSQLAEVNRLASAVGAKPGGPSATSSGTS